MIFEILKVTQIHYLDLIETYNSEYNGAWLNAHQNIIFFQNINIKNILYRSKYINKDITYTTSDFNINTPKCLKIIRFIKIFNVIHISVVDHIKIVKFIFSINNPFTIITDFIVILDRKKIAKFILCTIFKKFTEFNNLALNVCRNNSMEIIKYLFYRTIKQETLLLQARYSFFSVRDIKILKKIYACLETKNYTCREMFSNFSGKIDVIKYHHILGRKYIFSLVCRKGDVESFKFVYFYLKLSKLINDITLACESGNLELVKYMISDLKLNPNNFSSFPLRVAAMNGHTSVVEYLKNI